MKPLRPDAVYLGISGDMQLGIEVLTSCPACDLPVSIYLAMVEMLALDL